MMRTLRPTSAHVISLIALFVALGGSAYAVTAGKNTVKSKSIARGAVKTPDIANRAVSRAKLKPDAVPASAIVDGSIGAKQLGNVVIREASEPLNDNSSVNVEVFCKAGEKAIGGGGFGVTNLGTDITVNNSRPLAAGSGVANDGETPNGWEAFIFNSAPGGAGSGTAFAYVVCLQ